MQTLRLDKQDMIEMANLVATAVVEALKKDAPPFVANTAPQPNQHNLEKSAYQKTEQLLYNYKNFVRIVEERLQEIEDIRNYGVPRSNSVQEYVSKSKMPMGIVLEEESVESAIASVQRSVQSTVQAIRLINKGLDALKNDPYYKILELRYFDGRTQEDIAMVYNCSQKNISQHKTRLVRALALQLFPNQVVEEIMG